MASQRTKFTVGLFVAAGIALVIAAVVWLGMSRVLEKGRLYVTYFDESVQGLGRDSPVKYRGVSIGRVAGIEVAPDSKLIKVVMSIESGLSIDQDMVAQLNPVGITGAVFVEMDRKKAGEQDLSPVINFPSEYPVVASKPSDISKLFRSVDDILDQMKKLDLDSISTKIKATLDHANILMADARVKELAGEIDTSLKRVNMILANERWKRMAASMEKSIQAFETLLEKSGGAMDRLDTTLGRVDGLIKGSEVPLQATVLELKAAVQHANVLLEKGVALMDGAGEGFSQLRGKLLVIGQNLERATGNLDFLLENLAEQPARYLLAVPPPREVEGDQP